MVRRVSLVLGAVALVASFAVWWNVRPNAEPVYGIPGQSPSTTVEVLNGTGINGLAAAMTRQLRRHGIDVVYFGTAATDSFRVTQIVFRRPDTTSAARIRDVLGGGIVRVAVDSLKLLDATIILGRDVRPSDSRP